MRQPQQQPAVHPRRTRVHETVTRGERVADSVTNLVGSWPFILGQSAFILVWIALNSLAFFGHWDPYPWILLNLCMSTQAMFTGPFVMLSQNRQAAKDRLRDDTEAHEVELSTEILKELRKLIGDLHTHTTCAGHTTIESAPGQPYVVTIDGKRVRTTVTSNTSTPTPITTTKRTRKKITALPRSKD